MNAAPPTISIIVPTLNEETGIDELLGHLEALGPEEIIVADGGSTDRTVELAARRARVVETVANRGAQMNAGAAGAVGEVLLFLHADVRLVPGALDRVRSALAESDVAGGSFSIVYDGSDAIARAFTTIARWRLRFGIFYGDSGIFCRRSVFEELGGYEALPVLEDYEFARRLWKHGTLAFLNEPIHVSDRRWRRASLPGTLWSWFWIQGLYLAGVSPARLARMYRAVR